MDKKKLVGKAVMRLRQFNKWHIVQYSNKLFFKKLASAGIPLKKLTRDQKKKIDEVYKHLGYRYTYDTHILSYSVTGEFDARIVPEDIFRAFLEPKLNDVDKKFVLSDKNYFDLFMPQIRFPETIIMNIDGILYDAKRHIISTEKAKQILGDYEKVVVKPSVENGSGRGVQLVDLSAQDPLALFRKNYIVQNIIQQHPALSAFNESSVNVIRVVTMFMGDQVFPISSAFRFGGKGAFTDNTVTADGKGMTVVGIDDNGRLKSKGYYSCGLVTQSTPDGICFEGYELPKYQEMVDIAIREHSRFPAIKIIGWDFTVDKAGDVIAIEYNIKAPGVLYYQWVNGPLFGDKTTEILNYIKLLP